MPLFFVLPFCYFGNCSKCVISSFVISRTTSFNFLVYEPIKNQLKPFKCQEMVLDIFLFPNLIFCVWHDIQFKIISIIKLSFSCQTMRNCNLPIDITFWSAVPAACEDANYWEEDMIEMIAIRCCQFAKSISLLWWQRGLESTVFWCDVGSWFLRGRKEPLFFWKRLWWQFWHKLGEQVTTTASNICHEKLKK